MTPPATVNTRQFLEGTVLREEELLPRPAATVRQVRTVTTKGERRLHLLRCFDYSGNIITPRKQYSTCLGRVGWGWCVTRCVNLPAQIPSVSL